MSMGSNLKSIFTHSKYMTGAQKYKNGLRDPDHAPLGVICHPKANTRYSLAVSKIWTLQLHPFQRYSWSIQNLKWVTWLWPRAFQRWFDIGGLGVATINLPTKFHWLQHYLTKHRNTKIASFHSNAILLHCQTSTSNWFNLFSLVTRNSYSCT